MGFIHELMVMMMMMIYITVPVYSLAELVHSTVYSLAVYSRIGKPQGRPINGTHIMNTVYVGEGFLCY